MGIRRKFRRGDAGHRDRNGTFDPLLIARYQRRFAKFDTKIISMYARDMTTREIQAHIVVCEEQLLSDFENVVTV